MEMTIHTQMIWSSPIILDELENRALERGFFNGESMYNARYSDTTLLLSNLLRSAQR